MLSFDSPLRRLPPQLDVRQLVFCDGVRHAAEIADLAFERDPVAAIARSPHQRIGSVTYHVVPESVKVCASGQWSELTPWTRGSPLHLSGLNVTLGWNEVYEGVGLG